MRGIIPTVDRVMREGSRPNRAPSHMALIAERIAGYFFKGSSMSGKGCFKYVRHDWRSHQLLEDFTDHQSGAIGALDPHQCCSARPRLLSPSAKALQRLGVLASEVRMVEEGIEGAEDSDEFSVSQAFPAVAPIQKRIIRSSEGRQIQ